MSAERERRDYAVKRASGGWRWPVPAWLLRWRLRATCAEIERLEQALSQEFGLLETAPMHRELELLVAERNALATRLAERG